MRKILRTLVAKILDELARPSPGGPQTADKSWAAAIGVFLTYLTAALGFAEWPAAGELEAATALVAQAAGEGAALGVAAGLGAWLKRNRPKAPGGGGAKVGSPWGVVLAAALMAATLAGCAAAGNVGEAAGKAADRALGDVAERLDEACDAPGADLLQDALVDALNARMERNRVTGIVCTPKAAATAPDGTDPAAAE